MTFATGAELVIEKLIPDGKALGRLPDGRVVIASGALPGDRIRLDLVAESKGLVTARVHRLVTPSLLRIEPSCTVADRCGGCDWMTLPIDEQRRHKLAVLREALLRTGKLDWRDRPIELVVGERAEAYRGRVRLQVARGRIGFHERGSHELVEPERCAVSTDAVNVALRELRELARQHPGALDAFSWLELREASDGTLAVLLEPGAGKATPDAGAWLAALRTRFVVAVGSADGSQRGLWQRFQLTHDTYMLSSPAGFVQVNWGVNQALIARVLDGVRARGVETFLDAYSGSGNFTLPLLRQGLTGLAVESNPSAVAPLCEAARQQGLHAGEFVVADAAAHANLLARQARRYDLVLVDPPRSGLAVGLEPLARLARRWLLMCSCNPVTLARDLGRLVALGFELEELVAFDMFPQTHHLETLAWLRAPASALLETLAQVRR